MQRQLQGHRAVRQRHRVPALRCKRELPLELPAFFAGPVVHLAGTQDATAASTSSSAEVRPGSEGANSHRFTAVQGQRLTGEHAFFPEKAWFSRVSVGRAGCPVGDVGSASPIGFTQRDVFLVDRHPGEPSRGVCPDSNHSPWLSDEPRCCRQRPRRSRNPGADDSDHFLDALTHRGLAAEPQSLLDPGEIHSITRGSTEFCSCLTSVPGTRSATGRRATSVRFSRLSPALKTHCSPAEGELPDTR